MHCVIYNARFGFQHTYIHLLLRGVENGKGIVFLLFNCTQTLQISFLSLPSFIGWLFVVEAIFRTSLWCIANSLTNYVLFFTLTCTKPYYLSKRNILFEPSHISSPLTFKKCPVINSCWRKYFPSHFGPVVSWAWWIALFNRIHWDAGILYLLYGRLSNVYQLQIVYIKIIFRAFIKGQMGYLNEWVLNKLNNTFVTFKFSTTLQLFCKDFKCQCLI